VTGGKAVEDQVSWTYFIQSVDGGPIKIGFTSKPPSERLGALQTGSPTKLRLVGLIAGNQEKILHKRFSKDHSHGEWFSPSKELVGFIEAEASSLLQNHFASQARLQLEKTTVPILNVGKQQVSASAFDQVFPNNEDLFELLPDCCDWDEGDVWDGEGDPYEAELVSNTIEDMALLCQSAGVFVESVGVNADAGLVGFICGPCNSHRRMEVLRGLGSLARDVDSITASWFFFAIFWDRGRQIGINLLMLDITKGRDNLHIFDPTELLNGSCHLEKESGCHND
jgi:hypothetical protein